MGAQTISRKEGQGTPKLKKEGGGRVVFPAGTERVGKKKAGSVKRPLDRGGQAEGKGRKMLGVRGNAGVFLKIPHPRSKNPRNKRTWVIVVSPVSEGRSRGSKKMQKSPS